MKKHALLCACLMVLVLLCAGCGGQGEDPTPESAAGASQSTSPTADSAGPSADTPPDIVSAPVSDSSAGSGAGAIPDRSTAETQGIAEYTLDRSLMLDGRTLTLRLHGRSDTTDGFERTGISSIGVLEGDTLLQTISIGQAFDQLYREQGLEDRVGQQQWTDCWTEDGSLSTDDLNFDGYPDLRLMAGAGVVNISYLCWLWDNEAGQFRYAFELVGYGVTVDTENQQLITEARGGYGQYYTDYYTCDDSGTLRHIKQILFDASQAEGEEEPVITIHELINGEWVQTQ